MVSGPESRRVLGELAKDPEAWSKVRGDGEEGATSEKRQWKEWTIFSADHFFASYCR